jgi:hypothetical protein
MPQCQPIQLDPPLTATNLDIIHGYDNFITTLAEIVYGLRRKFDTLTDDHRLKLDP